ncbi:hypothetical protein BH09BAC1_BH09BAC1_27890 [soil metagenome]
MQTNIIKGLTFLLALTTITSCSKEPDPYKGSIAYASITQCCKTEHVLEINGTDTFYIPNLFLPSRDSQNKEFNIYSNFAAKINASVLEGADTLSSIHNLVIDSGYTSLWNGRKDSLGTKAVNGVYTYWLQLLLANGDTMEYTGSVCVLKEIGYCPGNVGSCYIPSRVFKPNTPNGLDDICR